MSLRAALPSSTAVVLGTQTNDNALPGHIGEYISQTVPSVAQITLTSGSVTGIADISLTPGDWDVWGVADFNIASTTSVTQLQAGISLSNSAFGSQTGGSGLGSDPTNSFAFPAFVPTNLPFTLVTPQVRVSLATTTTIWMAVESTFTVTGIQAYGTVQARRVR